MTIREARVLVLETIARITTVWMNYAAAFFDAIANMIPAYIEHLKQRAREEARLAELLEAHGFYLDRCYQIDLNDPRGTDEEDVFI